MSRRLAPPLALALAAVSLCIHASPAANTERKEFEAAMDLVGRDDARAAARLEVLADSDPQGEFADDALDEAARLAEERLGRPDHARDLYARLVARSPDSRLALRARTRLRFLDESLRTGVAPLAEYQRILAGYPSRPPSESARRMAALLAAHPDFALADRALLWLAGIEAREGHADEAERRYREVERRFPSGEAWARARRGRADLALAGRRPLAARALYRSLLDEAERRALPPEAALEARAGMHDSLVSFVHLLLIFAGLVYAALLVLARLVAARPIAAVVPFELRFYLPVAALFVAGAAGHGRPILLATVAIAVGGALVVGATALASIRQGARGPVSRARRLAQAAATALAIAAIVYAAVYATHLGDMVLETLRSGPER